MFELHHPILDKEKIVSHAEMEQHIFLRPESN